MRKITYGVASAGALAVVVGSLFVVFGTRHLATASAHAQKADIVNVRTLENKIDIRKLPVLDVAKAMGEN